MPEQQGSSALLEREADSDSAAPTDEQVLSALNHLASKKGTDGAKPGPNELKQRLNGLLFPAILLIFVALYVTSLAAGVEPEMGLLQAGGVSMVLAVLGRAAVGILGDETRLVLNDAQIVAMARSGAVRDYLVRSGTDSADNDSDQPSVSAQAGRTGGRE